MRFQIVTDDGEIVYSGGKPITADVTRILESEIRRHDIQWAKLLRDFIEESQATHLEVEERLVEQFKSEHFDLTMQHASQLDDIEALLHGTKVDVSGWRLLAKRRERIFAERIDGVVAEMVKATTKGS
jgi:hypothetical protein